MATTTIKSDIERFARSANACHRAIAGLTRAQLNTLPKGMTGWTIQQIVLHLADSHMIASARMRQVIAEDHPTIQAYDETLFAQRLHYDRMSAEDAAELFRLVQRSTAALLRLLPPRAFARKCTHSERGVLTLGELVRGYADHAEHHMKFVKAKRAAMGKPIR